MLPINNKAANAIGALLLSKIFVVKTRLILPFPAGGVND